jgi:hypothetical protein
VPRQQEDRWALGLQGMRPLESVPSGHRQSLEVRRGDTPVKKRVGSRERIKAFVKEGGEGIFWQRATGRPNNIMERL